MKKATIRISHVIRLPFSDLPDPVVGELKKRLIFRNPLFDSNLKFGRPNDGVQPYLYCLWHDAEAGDLVLARGFLFELVRILNLNRIPFEIVDDMQQPASVDFQFTDYLQAYQQEAVKVLEKKRFAILTGPAGAGKIALGLKMASIRKVPVLVIVTTKKRMYQWKDAASRLLNLGCKSIGLIGGGRRDVGRPFTIGVNLSLYRCIDQIGQSVGFAIVDECSRVPLKVLFNLVMPLGCPYMLSIAEAGRRMDGLTRLMCAYLGPIVHHLKTDQRFPVWGDSPPVLRVRRTDFSYRYEDDYAEMINSLCRDESRNNLLLADILQKVADPKTKAVVVSDRIEHLEVLKKGLEAAYTECEIITGKTPSPEFERVLNRFEKGKLQVILSTQKTAARMNTGKINMVFVACAFKDELLLTRLVNRMSGPAAGDSVRPEIFDYADEPEILRASLRRRIKVYRSLGAR